MTAPIHSDDLRALPELSAPGCPRETSGTTCQADCPELCRGPLERWRARCYEAAWGDGTGLPRGPGRRREDVRRGVARAITVANRFSAPEPLMVLQRVSEELCRVEATVDGRRDASPRGLRLACFWLREELARDGDNHA